jgi:site-specific recombinase XerD
MPEDVRAITQAHIYAYLGRIGSNGARLETRHRRHRVVRFGTKAREAVEDYVERFRGRESGPLFLSRHGTRMSSHSVLIFLRRLGKQAGVEKVKVHRFRHTFATWAIENEAREPLRLLASPRGCG